VRADGARLPPIAVTIPQDTRAVCMREASDQKAASKENETEPMTAEEKAGSVLIYIVGLAATAAAILVPLLLLL